MPPIRPTLALAVVALLAGCVAPDGEPVEAADETFSSPSDAVGSNNPITDEDPSEGGPAPVWIFARINGLYPANAGFELNVSQVPTNSTVTLVLRNDDMNPLGKHDWHLLEVEGAHTDVIAVGKETTITFRAPAAAGDYLYHCHVETHEDRGMKGTLRVVAA